MPRAKVVVESHFNAYAADLEKAVGDALGQGGHDVIRTAQQEPTNYNIRAVTASGRVERPERRRSSIVVGVYWADFRAMWFEKGTYRKLGMARTARAATGTHRGVKPQRFMRAAVNDAFPRIVERVHEAIRSVS